MSIDVISVALTAVSILVAIVGLINGWILVGQKNIREDITKLRDADTLLAGQIGAIRELVAGQYVTRVEFNAALDRQTATILSAMNRIADDANHRKE